MQRIVISVLFGLIVFLLGFEGFPIFDVQGIMAIITALLAGGLVYWILSVRDKRRAQTKEAIDNILQKIEKVEGIAESNRIFSLNSVSSINDLKNRTAKYFETVRSLVDVQFRKCLSGLEGIVLEIESQALKLSETGLASTSKVMEALEHLKAMDDGLGTRLAGISANLEAVKALSETIPAMREQIIGDIGATYAHTAEAFSHVQSGLIDLDKGYHDIVGHIEQSSSRSEENSRNAMTALAEGLKSQAALFNEVGTSSTAKVMEALERLKAMDDSLETGLAGIGVNLEAVKALSETIPAMREQIIGDIGATYARTAEAFSHVQSGLIDLDKGYHDIVGHIEQSSSRSEENSRNAMTALAEGLKSQAALLNEVGASSTSKVMEALERLKAMDDSLVTGLAGIGANLEAVKALSETIPAMREQIIGDIGATYARTAEAFSHVQSGLSDLDKGYHDIVGHIEQSSSRSEENSRKAMTALAEGLKSQAALLNEVGASSISKVMEALERLKAMDDSLVTGLAGIGANLEAVKALSEIIPGMRDRLINDISGAVNKVSQSSVVINSIKERCEELMNQVDELDEDVLDRIEELQSAYERSQFELSNDIDESLNRRESQMERERELGDREIRILKDIESIIKSDVDGK